MATPAPTIPLQSDPVDDEPLAILVPQTQNNEEESPPSALRRSARSRRPPDFYGNPVSH